MNKATILIIDDDESILRIFSRVLKEEDYSVLTAGSAKEGMALARERLPDLVLCDINMPETNGMTLLTALRKDPQLAKTQFVLMTGQSQNFSSRQGMNLGADDFLAKPFGFEELIRCVEARLQRARIHWRIEDRIVNDLKAGLDRTLPHEFFTPLVGIVGIASLLRSEWRTLEDSEIDEFLENMENSGWRLERTLRKYLMILNLDRPGSTEYHPEGIISGQITEAIVASKATALAARRDRASDLNLLLYPVEIQADKSLLEMIVEELVDNAFSFSKKGTPVQVELRKDAKLTVTDQGRGMGPDEVNRITAFQQFNRKQFEQQGLGIGLVLVDRLANLCGATVEIESVPGKGTVTRIQFRKPAPNQKD